MRSVVRAYVRGPLRETFWVGVGAVLGSVVAVAALPILAVVLR